MTAVFIRHGNGNPVQEFLGIRRLQRLEREVNHRIRSVMLAVAAIIGIPDGEALEERRGIHCRRIAYGGNLEEALHHVEVERLAESPRTAKERCLRSAVEHIGDEHGLVDEDGILHGGGKQVVTDGQHLAARKVGDTHIALPVNAVFVGADVRVAHRATSFAFGCYGKL